MSFKKLFIMLLIAGNISGMLLQISRIDRPSKSEIDACSESCYINGSTAAIGGGILFVGSIIPFTPIKFALMTIGASMVGASMNTLVA